MEKGWTKKCVCGNFIPDKYDVCDFCLLRKFGLLAKTNYSEHSNNTYDEEDVVNALRIAEKGGYKK